jgi:transcriptional regulator with XRE-family HTH domain
MAKPPKKRPDLTMSAAGRRVLLRNVLAAHGLTMAGVARRLKVGRPAVSRTIAGDLVSARIRRHLARLAGIPQDELFPPAPRLRRAGSQPSATRRASRAR